MQENDHIQITPGTCSGRPRIRGTRIRVANVVRWTEQGQSPEAIVAEYDHLTLAGVHAALSFYHDHREAIDRQIAEDEAAVESMMNSAHGDSLPSG